ncbi:MAG: fibronectin type III domain-containing protein [Lachnospiraceae bacterium]|nr:fibronectin type III domain-containing protein [Lachnospiraceae bacterium]
MKIKNILAYSILGAAILLYMPENVTAEESEEEVFPTCYEDGSISPVTTDGDKKIYLNGADVIFKEGKMYEDIAPFGEFDENDIHIYTYPYVEEWKDELVNGETWYDGKHEMDLEYVYVETGGDGDGQYTGDCYLTIEDTTLRGVYVDHVENAVVHIQDSDVLRNYIENAAGDVKYTIENNTGEVQEIYFQDTSAKENVGLVQGDLTLTLNHVKNDSAWVDILASGTVLGDTKIIVADSSINEVEAAHITGSDTQKGNVYMDAVNSTFDSIHGISNGCNSAEATINGDIDIHLVNCSVGGVYAFSSYIWDGAIEDLAHTVNGKGSIYAENSNIKEIRTYDKKEYGYTRNENTEVTLKNVETNYVTAGTVNLIDNVAATIRTDTLNAGNNACLTGNAEVYCGINGALTWQPYSPGKDVTFIFGKDIFFGKDASLKIVPIRKTEEGYKILAKDEYLEGYIRIAFDKRLDAENFLTVITCDYSDLRSYGGIHTDFMGVEAEYSGIEVLNYCPNHDWQKAADSGYAHIMDYANLYNKAATCAETGVETYYCTLCERYEIRTTSALGHNYYWNYKVEPTKTEQGYTIYTCSRCGDSYKTAFVDKLPKKPTLSSVKSTKKKTISVKWKKDKNVTGYIIQYSTDKKFKKSKGQVTIKKSSTTSTKIKKLKSKKTYYIRMASYKKVNGVTYTSAYTKAKKVKVK